MYIESVFFILIVLAVSPLFENEDQNVDLDLLFEKALESAKNSKFNDAIFYFDEILKYDPNNSLTLNYKGAILSELQKYDEALSYFEKAIEIDPNFAEAINNKAVVLSELNRDIDALTMFYESYKIDPFDLVTVENMASIVGEHPFKRASKDVSAFVKIEVRTSDDQLVSYIESHDISFQDPLAMLFLEDKAEWKPIEIDGKEFEVLEYSTNFPSTSTNLYATTKLALIEEGAAGVFVIHTNHDGLLSIPGDNVITTLTLLRPS